MESSDPTDSSQRNIVPPGSIPPPKGPPPTRLDPDSLPAGHDRPNQPENPPGDINWQGVDEEMQGILRQFEQIMQLMGTLPWDQLIEYLRRIFGNIPALNDRLDFYNWYSQHSTDGIRQWFRYRYPNATQEQFGTFIERVYGQFSDDMWEIMNRYYFPSDVPENETPQEGPSERDRDRALERWERQNY